MARFMMMRRLTGFLAAGTMVLSLSTMAAQADRFRNPTAIFAGLDKITGRIIAFEVAVNETVQFGALQLTPKVCYTRPVTERPQTTSFVEVDEISASNEYKRLFSGWMFAASPGLNAIEHPVYDIWLTGCKGATENDLMKTKPDEEEALTSPTVETPGARPVGPDGKPQIDPLERAAMERRRQQQLNRSTTAGPILPGQPLNTVPAPQQRPASQSFFPLPGFGGGNRSQGGSNPGIYVDPARR